MRQGHREKLSVTVDPRVYDAIEQHAARTKLPKSKIVEEAIRVWERARLAALAREGYQITAPEDLADVEAYLAVLDEIREGRLKALGGSFEIRASRPRHGSSRAASPARRSWRRRSARRPGRWPSR